MSACYACLILRRHITHSSTDSIKVAVKESMLHVEISGAIEEEVIEETIIESNAIVEAIEEAIEEHRADIEAIEEALGSCGGVSTTMGAHYAC